MAVLHELHPHMRRQHGVVTLEQALACGLSRHQLQRLVGNGVLERVARGVYAVGGLTPEPRRELMAAQLASGGVACRASAAHLLGMLGDPPQRPHVLVHGSSRPRVAFARVHRTDTLPRTDIVGVGPFRATHPVRTLVDLAGDVSDEALEMALSAAIARLGVRPGRVLQRIDRLGVSGRPGVRRLRELALGYLDGASETPLEVLLARALREGGVPAPRLQHWVEVAGRRYRLDCAWPAPVQLFCEGDGLGVHATKSALESDFERQNHLVVAGWAPLRFGWGVLRTSPDSAVAVVLDALRSRGVVA